MHQSLVSELYTSKGCKALKSLDSLLCYLPVNKLESRVIGKTMKETVISATAKLARK